MVACKEEHFLLPTGSGADRHSKQPTSGATNSWNCQSFMASNATDEIPGSDIGRVKGAMSDRGTHSPAGASGTSYIHTDTQWSMFCMYNVVTVLRPWTQGNEGPKVNDRTRNETRLCRTMMGHGSPPQSMIVGSRSLSAAGSTGLRIREAGIWS
jgi:hypothetical protein